MATPLEGWLAAQHEDRVAAGLTRSLRARPPDDGAVDLAGNNYLGLAHDPRIIDAAVSATRTWGAGATASRLVSGTTELHAELERALATFCGQPDALVFSSGYLANLGVVTALADTETLIVSDAHMHASMIDACRLTRAQVQVVGHNDLAAVEHALRRRQQPRALVLAESIYSVLGDAAPLQELADCCARHGASLIIDEAHALGVAGDGGRGLAHQAGLAGRDEVLITATLSKALGAQGGAVLGSAAVCRHLVNRARPFIFDTGLAPTAAGAAHAAIDVVQAEPERVHRLRCRAQRLAEAVRCPSPAGAVLTVPLPSAATAVAAAARCAAAGVRVGCFRPPSTPDEVSRLRITASAALTDHDLQYATAILREAIDPASACTHG